MHQMADIGGDGTSLLMGPFDPSAFTGESVPWLGAVMAALPSFCFACWPFSAASVLVLYELFIFKYFTSWRYVYLYELWVRSMYTAVQTGYIVL